VFPLSLDFIERCGDYTAGRTKSTKDTRINLTKIARATDHIALFQNDIQLG